VTVPAVTIVTATEFSAVREAVRALDQAATQADGYPSLNEAVWRDLDHPDPESAGFLADGCAYAHVARSDNFSPRHWALGCVVAPAARADGAARAAVLRAALNHVRERGGGRVAFWLLGAADADDTALGELGFARARDLYEMRVPLPLDETPHWPPNVEVRTFEPGRDERAWLDVNNRAFANHAEQGGWIEETLHRRIEEPWFDPKLFFLAFDAKGLAGFNWLKIHDAHGRDPRLGEIFVIGVDPRMQGSGLGRALAIHGLSAVHDRGIDAGSLFVAAENAGALRLYHSLGFEIHRTDRAYETEVAP
jgi:mycothiol synthase